MGPFRTSLLAAVLVLVGSGCSGLQSDTTPSSSPRPPRYVMGAGIDAGGVTIRVQSVSDNPSPGPAAQEGEDLFAVLVTLHVSGQGDWIGIDRFGLKVTDDVIGAVTDLVAGSIEPLGRLRTGTTVSGWVGFVAPRPGGEPIFIYRSRTGDEYEFALEPDQIRKPGPPRVAPTRSKIPPSAGSSSDDS